jgi:sulfoxide reductase catalytic subunit YedY
MRHGAAEASGASVQLVVSWNAWLQERQDPRANALHRQGAEDRLERGGAKRTRHYSNVNSGVDHPRWSQATGRRVGEGGLFAKKGKPRCSTATGQVGQLYAGMDLKRIFL